MIELRYDRIAMLRAKLCGQKPAIGNNIPRSIDYRKTCSNNSGIIYRKVFYEADSAWIIFPQAHVTRSRTFSAKAAPKRCAHSANTYSLETECGRGNTRNVIVCDNAVKRVGDKCAAHFGIVEYLTSMCENATLVAVLASEKKREKERETETRYNAGRNVNLDFT